MAAKLICVSIFIEVKLTALLASMTSIPPGNRRKTADKVPANEQEQQIYKFVSENAGVTTAQALLKALYLATFEATKKWTMPVRNWGGRSVESWQSCIQTGFMIRNLPNQSNNTSRISGCS